MSSLSFTQVSAISGSTGSPFVATASDTIFATGVQMGRTVLNVSLTGCRTSGEALETLAGLLKGVCGLVTVTLRNVTQGTTLRRVLCMSRYGLGMAFPTGLADDCFDKPRAALRHPACAEGTQLSLQF